MILPTIHPNGTPRQILEDGYLAAYSSVLKAMSALAQVVQARDHLDACKTYLGTIINSLMDQR